MQLNPLWDLGFALVIVATARWYRDAAQRAGIARWRRRTFAGGLIGLALITVGPIAHAAVDNFWIHMVQHVAIMMLLSPALVLGAPVAAAHGAGGRVGDAIERIVGSAPMRLLLRPRVGWVVFAGTVIATHYSPLADAAMGNSSVHSLVIVLYLVAGLIYYLPLMDGNPLPVSVPHAVRFGSLLAMMVPETMTGFFMYVSTRMLHALPPGATSAAMPDMAGMAPLTDQRIGGAIMWGVGMLIDATWVAVAMRDWMADERRRAEADDALAAAEGGAR